MGVSLLLKYRVLGKEENEELVPQFTILVDAMFEVTINFGR